MNQWNFDGVCVHLMTLLQNQSHSTDISKIISQGPKHHDPLTLLSKLKQSISLVKYINEMQSMMHGICIKTPDWLK